MFSHIPNYESIPMKSSVRKNKKIQNFGNGRLPKAAGYVIKARSIPSIGSSCMGV